MRPLIEAGGGEGRRVALFGDKRDWHVKQLTAAFEKRGVRVTVLSLRDCGIETGRKPALVLPGFEDRLPDFAFVKSVPGGTFEEVTLRLGVLHALEAEGVKVWNNPRAIERCVDKSMTSYLIAKAGLPTPPTWVVQGREKAIEIVKNSCGKKLVLKPLFGAQGRGLRLIEKEDDLPNEEEVGEVYYLQIYVGKSSEWVDYRIFIVKEHVIGAMSRVGASWITNVSQGGTPRPYIPSNQVVEISLNVSYCLGVDYAGVDLIAVNKNFKILEVNSMPAWSSLQTVTKTVIGDEIVDKMLC